MADLGYKKKLHVAATTGDGNVIDTRGETTEHTIYLQGNGSVSAGAIQMETAIETDYTGTWAPLGGPVTVVADATVIVQITGAFAAMRARISTTIAGGTVTVEAVGN
jgi:hypothetical protein